MVHLVFKCPAGGVMCILCSSVNCISLACSHTTKNCIGFQFELSCDKSPEIFAYVTLMSVVLLLISQIKEMNEITVIMAFGKIQAFSLRTDSALG